MENSGLHMHFVLTNTLSASCVHPARSHQLPPLSSSSTQPVTPQLLLPVCVPLSVTLAIPWLVPRPRPHPVRPPQCCLKDLSEALIWSRLSSVYYLPCPGLREAHRIELNLRTGQPRFQDWLHPSRGHPVQTRSHTCYFPVMPRSGLCTCAPDG